jgi:hypothetical protein
MVCVPVGIPTGSLAELAGGLVLHRMQDYLLDFGGHVTAFRFAKTRGTQTITSPPSSSTTAETPFRTALKPGYLRSSGSDDNGKPLPGARSPAVEVLLDRICRENGISHRNAAVRSPTTTFGGEPLLRSR